MGALSLFALTQIAVPLVLPVALLGFAVVFWSLSTQE
jgi:hypothetical protein